MKFARARKIHPVGCLCSCYSSPSLYRSKKDSRASQTDEALLSQALQYLGEERGLYRCRSGIPHETGETDRTFRKSDTDPSFSTCCVTSPKCYRCGDMTRRIQRKYQRISEESDSMRTPTFAPMTNRTLHDNDQSD